MAENRKPIVEIEPREELIDVTFEEYLKKRYEGTFFDGSDLPEDKNDLYTKYQYLIDTVTDFTQHKTEIKELWSLTIDKLKNEKFDFISFNEGTIKFLVEMTARAGFTEQEVNIFDSNLHFAILDHIEKELESSLNPSREISEIIYYLTWHNTYLALFKLGLPVSDFRFIDNIFNRYPTQLEIVKNQAPSIYVRFIELFKQRYKTEALSYNKHFIDLYQRLSLEAIIVSKNFGFYSNYYRLLEDYYSFKLADRKKINWAFKNLIGYGERPWMLLYLFFSVNILFALIFSTGLFGFNKEIIEWPDRFVSFFYFNNTSMLTVGYGDIYPTDVPAKLLVVLLQIIGFIISGSSIALLLRRILRF